MYIWWDSLFFHGSLNKLLQATVAALYKLIAVLSSTQNHLLALNLKQIHGTSCVKSYSQLYQTKNGVKLKVGISGGVHLLNVSGNSLAKTYKVQAPLLQQGHSFELFLLEQKKEWEQTNHLLLPLLH